MSEHEWTQSWVHPEPTPATRQNTAKSTLTDKHQATHTPTPENHSAGAKIGGYHRHHTRLPQGEPVSTPVEFRRRHPVLRAIQFTGDNDTEIRQWITDLNLNFDPDTYMEDCHLGEWLIHENGYGFLLNQEQFEERYEPVPTNEKTYRLGSHQKQNVYRHDSENDPDGHYIGVFFDPRDARHACNALNAYDKDRDTDDTVPPPRPKRDRTIT